MPCGWVTLDLVKCKASAPIPGSQNKPSTFESFLSNILQVLLRSRCFSDTNQFDQVYASNFTYSGLNASASFASNFEKDSFAFAIKRPGLQHWALPAVFPTAEESHSAVQHSNDSWLHKGYEQHHSWWCHLCLPIWISRWHSFLESLGCAGFPRNFLWPSGHSFISVTRKKLPIWTQHKIRPASRASSVTGLIWRGPKSAKRTAGLKRVQEVLESDVLKIKEVHSVCWFSFYNSLMPLTVREVHLLHTLQHMLYQMPRPKGFWGRLPNMNSLASLIS